MFDNPHDFWELLQGVPSALVVLLCGGRRLPGAVFGARSASRRQRLERRRPICGEQKAYHCVEIRLRDG